MSNQKIKTLAVISVAVIALTTTFGVAVNNSDNILNLRASSASYECGEITFGTEVVGTGSSKDVTGSFYTITNWTNSKHTDGKASVIGGTTSTKREGEFTVNLSKNTCGRAIVYACGYEGDALSNIYLSINGSEQKVDGTKTDEPYTFKAYSFENINSDTLTFKNIRGDKKGRVAISKIILRLFKK